MEELPVRVVYRETKEFLCIPLFCGMIKHKVALLYYKIDDPAWRLMAAKTVYDNNKKFGISMLPKTTNRILVPICGRNS